MEKTKTVKTWDSEGHKCYAFETALLDDDYGDPNYDNEKEEN